MRWDYKDYLPGVFDPTALYVSSLPDLPFLKNSTLDPGLRIGVTDLPLGETSAAIRQFLSWRAAIDSLNLQRFSLYDMASNVGVLRTYAPQMRQLLQGIDIGRAHADNPAILARELAQSAVGAVAEGLSMSGNPYAMIAGAIVGFAVMMWNLFETPEKQLPKTALPAQQYDGSTDTTLFNIQIRGIISTKDWTSLFLPRMSGDPTLQYRKDSVGRYGFAVGLGRGGLGENVELLPGGGLGMIPGGRKITAPIQSIMMEKPHTRAPFYETRCGHCQSTIYGLKVQTADVGTFYPNSGQGMLLLWDTCQKIGPSMFAVDANALRSSWQTYMDAMWESIRYFWGRKVGHDYWGIGAWRCALWQTASQLSVGMGGAIGGIGSVGLDTCKDDPFTADVQKRWNRTNLYSSIIDTATHQMLIRQAWALRWTTIAAYVDESYGAFKNTEIRGYFDQARQRILQSNEKYTVRLDDVVDAQYLQALKDAGGGVKPGFEVKLSIPPEPEPPSPPPKGGNPFPLPPPTSAPEGMSAAQIAGIAVAVGIPAAAAYYYFRR